MNRKAVLVALALPLALGLGLAIAARSGTGDATAAAECADIARDIVERYHLRATRPADEPPQQRLLRICMSDPATFARLTHKASQ